MSGGYFFMKLMVSKSKNTQSLYVTKSFRDKNGKCTSKIVEKLGTYDELLEKLNGQDPIEWAKDYIKELTIKEKIEFQKIKVSYAPAKQIQKDKQRSFNGGYLFLQKIYSELGLSKVCKDISQKYKFQYDLDSILSRLVYSRIIFPSSKRSTCKLSERFLQPPAFDLHQIYRALAVIAKEAPFIQSSVYKNSLGISKRNTGVLYYDCTNYFFEIEEEKGDRKYGFGKDHKPNPLIQMGLFMDGDGIPLAFNINPGNTNEQTTLQPLEEQILSDFNLSKFVVCTDAGLASATNRKFNDKYGRSFITTQSIKKLKKHLKEWALDPKGWYISDNTIPIRESMSYDISRIDEEKYKNTVFYKERWIKENDLEQRLIVTYSIKYKNYCRKIRNEQVRRAAKLMATNPTKLEKSNQNDFKRFIRSTPVTIDGEIAKKKVYTIKDDLIAKEEDFDGFYGVCTTLEDDVSEIISINHRRWEIEECFRIMKSEFKARPVFLSTEECIKAHFLICFLALIHYRLLEKRLNNKFTCPEIIRELKDMNFYEVAGEGYIPTYTRTDLTDALHDSFDFHTDYEIITRSDMKKIFSKTKK